MIVSNTPPPSKYWSDKQLEMYDFYLKDKNSTLAYYMTTKDGFPLYSPNKKGWKAKAGLLQKAQPSKEIVPCTSSALHATFDVEEWIKFDCKIWVVAMIGKIVDTGEKICAAERKIIGSYHPNDLSREMRLNTYPQFNLNQTNTNFVNATLARKSGEGGRTYNNKISNVNFTDSRFSKCEFIEIDFVNCDFSGTSFDHCDFSACSFIDCKFDNTYMGGSCKSSLILFVGKIKDLKWFPAIVPTGFHTVNYKLTRIKKGKKNV